MSDSWIPYGRQSVDESDREAVQEVLQGDWLTQGPAVPDFEEAVATRVGADHAVLPYEEGGRPVRPRACSCS